MTKRKKKGRSNRKLAGTDTNADKTTNVDKPVGDATLKSSTVQTVKVEGQPAVGFGEADDPPYLIEVRPTVQSVPTLPLKKYNLRMRGGVQVIGKKRDPFVATLSHQRYNCFYNPFTMESAGTMGSTGNLKHCQKCFCYVCDKPAADCEQWSNHCHAYKTDDWDRKRWVARNALIKHLVEKKLLLEERTYEVHKKVTKQLNRAWRLYEAGNMEHEEDKQVLVHKFLSVLQWTTKFLNDSKSDNSSYAGLIILDTVTKVTITRSWRPPKDVSLDDRWDTTAEKQYKQLCLTIGITWLRFLALQPTLAEMITKRMLKFSKVTKEKQPFYAGFRFIKAFANFLSLKAANDTQIQETKSLLVVVTNAFVTRRNNGSITKERKRAYKNEDNIVLPLLYKLLQKIDAFQGKPYKEGHFYYAKFKVLHDFEPKSFIMVLKHLPKQSPNVHLNSVLESFYATIAQKQFLPTKAKAYFDTVKNFIRLLTVIALNAKLTTTQMVQAKENFKICIQKLTEKFKSMTKDIGKTIQEKNNYKWEVCNFVSYCLHSLLKNKVNMNNLENVIVTFYLTTLSMSGLQVTEKDDFETRMWVTDSYDDFKKNFKRLTSLNHSKLLFRKIDRLYQERKSKTTLRLKRKCPITVTKNKKTRKE